MKVIRIDTLDTAVNAIDAIAHDDIGTVTMCSG